MQKTCATLPSIQVRLVESADIPSLLPLINADHLSAQPICQVEDITNALKGKATIDRGWWDALTTIQTLVVTLNETIVGAASYGIRKQDHSPFADAGFLLWLHAHENREVTELLLSAVLLALRSCPHIYAFWIATPLTLGVEGLPKEHRPIMHDILLNHGFVGADEWLYMRGPVMTKEVEAVADVKKLNTGWKLVVHDEGKQVAEAEIGIGKNNVGVLWWIEVQEEQRGHGLGKKLLSQALNLLAEMGAKEVILYVDHDDPTQRDRRAALHLYHSQGFSVIDHLWSYQCVH